MRAVVCFLVLIPLKSGLSYYMRSSTTYKDLDRLNPFEIRAELLRNGEQLSRHAREVLIPLKSGLSYYVGLGLLGTAHDVLIPLKSGLSYYIVFEIWICN